MKKYRNKNIKLNAFLPSLPLFFFLLSFFPSFLPSSLCTSLSLSLFPNSGQLATCVIASI